MAPGQGGAMSHDRITSAARLALAAGGLVCVVGMVGPFQGVERTLVPWDKAAHFLAFYGATLAMFAAFPTLRRFDLVMIAVLAGCGIELAQQLSGRDAELGDIAADTAGALAVWAPVWLERLRQPRRERRRRGTRAARPARARPAAPAGRV